MIQRYTRLNVADNSGARKVMCIGIPGHSHSRYARLGDIITVSVKEAIPNAPEPVKAGKVARAVVVRVAANSSRADGTYIRFDDNAVVILGDEKNPLGSRIMGPVARELRERGYTRILSLAPEVV
ncbi:MAG: 50S ribosomal protein L14 [SAR202 cluster bacterium]|nr:50S ribosomal protein L14 [SAR202 cluster bacterium]